MRQPQKSSRDTSSFLLYMCVSLNWSCLPLRAAQSIFQTNSFFTSPLCGRRRPRRLGTHTLLAEDIKHELRGSVVLVDRLTIFERSHCIKPLVEEVGRVKGTRFGLRMKLQCKNRPILVNQSCCEVSRDVFLLREHGALTLIAAIVQVDEIRLKITRQGASIDCVSVILARDQGLTICKV
jgi:hypothetical protein